MTDVEGESSSVLSEATFQEMIKAIDKDGDGTVTKDEYKEAYKKAFPKTTDEEFEALWKKIDKDGDGNLTTSELAAYYGFKLGKDGGDGEMDDDDILKMLQLQAAVVEEKEKTPEPAAKTVAKVRDASIKTVKITGVDANKISNEDEKKMCELLQKAHEAHSFPESLKEILEMLAPGQKGEPDKTGELCKINVRIEDPEKQTCLHKLARVKSDELTFEHKTKYKNVITTLLACLRVQCAAEKKVLKDDINLADKYGKTPLFLAVENKNSLLIKDLYSQENGVKYEPDAMKANANGWTVLHAAVHTESLDMLELLMNYLGKGRSKLLLQTEDKTGRRPLHIAAYKCDETIVQYLTKKCAEYEVDMAKKDSAGNTAGIFSAFDLGTSA